MRGRAGFTLVEMLLALALLALLAGLGVANLRPHYESSQSHALALEVAQELRSARDRALASGQPVALVFPSLGGGQPHSQSFQVITGQDQPRVVRSIDLTSQYPRACVFVGLWTLDPSTMVDGGATNRRYAQPAQAGSGMLPLDAWLPASMKQDYCLVFGPDGRLRTNDLTWFDGSVHLLACDGVDYSGVAAPPGTPSLTPGPGYFQPTRVGSPWTVSVTPLGDVELSSGVRSSSGVQETTSLTSHVPPARVGVPHGGGNQAPVIGNLDVFPQKNPLTAPPSTDATVAQDGYLTMQMRATDPDGDALFCQWTADGGALSSAAEDRMEWDPQGRCWTSTWHWKPPEDALVGARFNLTYRVFDSRGEIAGPLGASVRTLEVIPRSRIVFYRSDSKSPSPTQDVYTIFSDGTGLTRVTDTPNMNERPTSVSSDGTWLTFQETVPGQPADLGRMYLDGSGRMIIGDDSNWDLDGAISPDRDLVTRIWEPHFPGWEVWLMRPDGTDPRFLADMHYTGPLMVGTSCFSPDGQQVLYARYNGSDWDLHRIGVDGTGDTPFVTGPAEDARPAWGPDGWIWFTSDRDGNQELYKIRQDGSGLTRMTNTAGNEGSPRLSPDGSQVTYSLGGDLYLMNTDGTNPTQLTSDAASDGSPNFVP